MRKQVLEAHVVTTLSESCQHLILIGDHQQLRPSPTVFELSKFYNLDISLFERLIKNQLHHTTLTLQHRMKPQIANLVRHVYPTLEDHVSTTKRKNFGETRTNETSSKMNDHEADFCLCLCRYLLQQDYSRHQITILAGYSGQVFALKSRMKKEAKFFEGDCFDFIVTVCVTGVRVTTIDNYQGEENDIIILSLVRSNEEGNVGFLGTDNRVCVALSRARDGLYAIGNFKILAEKSELWRKIVKTAKDNHQLGNSLILRCQNHPGTETKVSCKDDFKNVPEGGCKKPCAFKLSCGHGCLKLCHGYDRDHIEYQCKKNCERMACNNGHVCQHRCYEPCGKCTYRIEKVIPMCGHKARVECHRDPGAIVSLPVQVERTWPCGHLMKVPCNATPATRPCAQPCQAKLECGHVCQGTCGECWEGRVHKDCGKSCNKLLPGCGHVCPLPCGSKCLPCKEKTCQTRCKHGNCALVCGEPCKPCEERCPWKCEHVTCQSFCHMPCQPCSLKCDQRLKCGHLCSGSCAEICLCYKCENDKKTSNRASFKVRFMNSIHEILNTSGDTFIMAETTAYFEAYRHVLEGLQEMKTNVPLARYIVECKTDIKPPQYARGYGTTLNIRYLLKDECQQNTQVSALLPTRWPPVENTPFNQSQYDAVKTALTKEIAIIQGPPGTGKTYVGLKVAKVLLDNREVWTSKTDAKPMLVVCYTNHALDQFLEGILEFCPDGIVRIGNRCKTEQLDRFNLKQIRAQIRKEKRVKLDIRNSINDCFKGLCNLRERVERVSARLEATTKGILGENALKEAIPSYHYISLVRNRQTGLTGAPSRDKDTNGWEMPKAQRKQQERRLQHLLKTSQAMSEREASAITDVWSHRLQVKDRVRLYLFWLDRYQTSLKDSIKDEADTYEEESKRLQELKFAEDRDILRSKAVIGMTTTGAARYRSVLKDIGCPIVLLEEAAEVLEAHVVTTLSESCQHLILIGDHQQLRPSPTVFELSKFYNLDISLFERLIKNQLHHST
ncbi:hypothetical protein C0Q70_19516 [Pomacea canaliculata]|uniref:NFX1-type zinc finger-containing protein 1 n=1 Tax=Pomacea canaliculata TaxID=400727 RepID=A0A2T7NJJ6_POMCA|nr:hypothetical protein C0Q70_19516 [Pomacea canaliculata]